MADACLEGVGMRKDMGEGEFVPGGQVAVTAGLDEDELTDEELLGASTLAKITGKTITIASDEDAENIGEVWEGLEEEIEEETDLVDEEIDEIVVPGEEEEV
jgi:hypothetical protein